ncbi:MAG: polysaccharide deacetylase family protein [Deltaproteobacteria bacterium]|nr:polysaccharide deacetylase family protein [Deltaproteobacteria bacterium]
MARPDRIEWPNSARLALSVVLNVELFTSEKPSGFHQPVPSGTLAERDTLTVTDRAYGYNAGLPRLLEILARHGVRSSVALNGLVAERDPDLVRRLHAAGHEIMGHGYDQAVFLITLRREEEAEHIARTVAAIERAIGERPVGWLSHAARATESTAELLAQHGFRYHCDDVSDDLPFLTTAGGRPILIVPYSLLNNDFQFYAFGKPPLTPDEAVTCLRREFDVLYAEGARCPKMMTYGVHPYVTGRPGRCWAFEQFLMYAKSFPGVWFARRDEIAEWWLQRYA